MSTSIIDNIDWVKYMEEYAVDEAELLKDGKHSKEWVRIKCRQAAMLALAECPHAYARLRAGRLSESDFAMTVCEMVMRLVRYSRYQSESNGNYQYTQFQPQSNAPGTDPSPRLFVSKADKTMLNGFSESRGSIGHISLGFDPSYGGA